MTFSLRPYQRECADAIISHLRSSIEPIMIEAATGSGKSVILAEVARHIHHMTGKRVLVTAPAVELVTQNRAKYLATGNPASVFSSSAGEKSLRHPVVFGGPLTIKNRISAFKNNYALIAIDECDLLTPTLLSIIDAMRDGNPNLRIVGMTATPYRLGSGYIYREGPEGRLNGEDTARNPFFAKSVFCIGGRELIKQGYLTPPVIGAINAERYDTANMQLNRMGKFDQADIDRAYHGKGRVTSAAVSDIVYQSRNRRGVLIYAATIQHAQEVMASLPPQLSAIIDGTTKDRKDILARFARQEIKYLVNVMVLTVGVDLPHVDVIAVLRKTESVRLLQQIIGRGLRLYPGKQDCLYLDYTDNVSQHAPDGDLFAPVVRAKPLVTSSGTINAICEECHYTNEFSLNKDYLDYPFDENGYCIDAFGNRIETEYGPMPVHHGRRCFGMVRLTGSKDYERCGYRWAGKPCPACGEQNDIAARYCYICKAEIVDPGLRILSEFRAMKRDPTQVQSDEVISMECKHSISQKGNPTLRVDWVVPTRHFSTWFMPETKIPQKKQEYLSFIDATDSGNNKPKTISYVKDAESGFFRVLGYNREADKEPELPIVKMKRTG